MVRKITIENVLIEKMLTYGYLFAAFYGTLFMNEEEAAFSNYRLWESFGFVIAYILSWNFKNYTKLIILSVVLGIGMIGYFIIECKISQNSVSNEEKKKSRY